jgi:phospho-N-acetylmuramoyl-pentapeptide-transferase
MARALLLAAMAFFLTLIVGWWWVRFARRHKLGKQIRIDGPQSHMTKMGTPTMGGIMVVSTVVALTVLFNLVDRWSMLLPLAVLVSFAVLGGIDDWMTLTGSKSKTYGFTVRYKFLLMLAVSFIASLALYLPPPFGLAHGGKVQVPFFGQQDLGFAIIPIATLIIVGTANAVNLTDGLDSLAGWNLTLAFAAYGVMTFLAEPQLTNLMAFSFTLVGACAAFLWFNAHPAQVFMGDLGALALGATLAVVALQSQQWLLLPVVGIVFVAEAISVMLQTSYFKWTRRRYGEGRRLLKMAPLHHHFELLGWSQVQVTQRFVLIGTMAAMVGISLAIIFATPAAPRQADQPPATQVVETAP